VTDVLAESTWRARQRAHRERVLPWVQPRQERRRVGRNHPVDDFLFDYYPYSVNKLITWHPGHAVALAGEADEYLSHPAYVRVQGGVTTTTDWLDGKRQRLDLAIALLEGTSSREPQTGCFALHEWAMVYGLEQSEIRHSSHALRLPPAEVRRTVDSVGLRCTHIDAFRFFTDEAVPLNTWAPTRATQPDLEQPGCLHANMDLYKYAMWFSPLVASDLVADCFDLARQARSLDMRASPYDVRPFELEPIPVETPEGRRAFVTEQADIASAAAPLRARLLDGLKEMRRASLPAVSPLHSDARQPS
jgi:hypothetical protein